MRWIVCILVSLLAAGTVHAQGVSIHSHSGCALGRNSAGVADPCADGSAVFYNPAALALQRGVVSAGAVALYTTSEFTFDDTGESFDSEQGTAIAPHAWLAVPITPRIAAGIGLWAPYGLATEWPLDFEGRFVGYDNTLQGIYIQPTIAAELIPDRLSLGIGVAAVRGSVEINRRVDLARTVIPGTDPPVEFRQTGLVPDGTDFADVRLKGDDWTATFHVGLQFMPSERWSLGARYLHSADLDLTGTADFTQVDTDLPPLPAGNPFGVPAGTPVDALLTLLFQNGGPLVDQRLATGITLPNQFVIGARFLATPAAKLFFDYQWTGWDDFDQAVLEFETAPDDTLFLDFHDASTFRLAAEYAARDDLDLRAGLLYNTNAAPVVTVTPLLPEADRVSFTGGAGYRFTDRFNADLGLEVLLQEKRRGRVRPRTTRSQTDLNVGDYTAHGVFLGLTLSYLLGRSR